MDIFWEDHVYDFFIFYIFRGNFLCSNFQIIFYYTTCKVWAILFSEGEQESNMFTNNLYIRDPLSLFFVISTACFCSSFLVFFCKSFRYFVCVTSPLQSK